MEAGQRPATATATGSARPNAAAAADQGGSPRSQASRSHESIWAEEDDVEMDL